MKYKKLVNELNNHLELASKEQHKHQTKLKSYLGRFKTEEQDIRTKLEKENDKTSRRKLKKELDLVKVAYGMLCSNL